MSNILKIPADVIPELREALLCMLGDAVDDIGSALTHPGRELSPEWFVEGRGEFERACALLDLIGWDGWLRPKDTTVDGAEHAATLKEALERYLPLLENWRDEAELGQASPPSAEDRAKHEQHTSSVLAIQRFLSGLQRRSHR
jgi:hypothetical protein